MLEAFLDPAPCTSTWGINGAGDAEDAAKACAWRGDKGSLAVEIGGGRRELVRDAAGKAWSADGLLSNA